MMNNYVNKKDYKIKEKIFQNGESLFYIIITETINYTKGSISSDSEYHKSFSNINDALKEIIKFTDEDKRLVIVNEKFYDVVDGKLIISQKNNYIDD